MNLNNPATILCASLVLAACGPGKSDDEGSTTDPPVPLVCYWEQTPIEDGEQFTTPDGCATYECSMGALNVVADNRITIAGDLDLPTQEDVDAQQCLGLVEGSLTISGTATDLSNLLHLYRVGADLSIVDGTLQSTTGLEGLNEVGEDIVIADNSALTTLSFRPNMSAFGDVTIQNNDVLTTLNGAQFIGQCSTCVGIGNEPGGGAPAESDGGEADGGFDEEPSGDTGEGPGGTFFGNILIADNDQLLDVVALSNLSFAWGDLRLTNNPVLPALGYMRLAEVQGALEISHHPSLNSNEVDTFVAGVDVWGEMIICGNQGGVACPE